MRAGVAAAVVAVLIVAAGGGYWWRYHGAAPAQPAAAGAPPQAMMAMPVEAVPVTVGPVSRSIRAIGSLRSAESVIITSEVAGRIVQIPAGEGQKVSRGTLLLALDAAIPQAELEQARARLELSRANHDRAVELQRRGAGTSRTLDEASASLREDQAAVLLAEARFEKTRIVAPFDGVLGLRRVSVGRYLSPGEEIINLEAIDPVKVDFRIPEVYLTAVRPSQRIEIEIDALPGQSFAGEVYAIDPLIDAAGRSIVIRARVPNADGRLRPGLFARVSLIVERREDAIQVPERAIFPVGEELFVYRVADGKAARVKVEVGERRQGNAEVVRGLAPNDMVVTEGHQKIGDGAPVQVVAAGGA